MNTMFKGLPNMMNAMNSMSNMTNVINQVKQLSQNPNGIYEFLKNSGRLNDQQLQAISSMRSPQEIGQYLMQGVPQNMYGQIQNNVQSISRQMK